MHVLDFDPHRKCMSVVVKDLADGSIYLMTKGAESSLDNCMIDDDLKENAFRNIEEFGAAGLRTLGEGDLMHLPMSMVV